MNYMYLYLIGCLICVIMIVRRIYKDGKLTLGDVFAIVFIISLSWVSILFFVLYKIVDYLDKHADGSKVLWERKDKED